MPPTSEKYFFFFLSLFDHICQSWIISDHFGARKKKQSKVTSEKSGALTGRTNDTHLGSKMIPIFKKNTFEFYVSYIII